VDLFDAMSPFIKSARSEGLTAKSTDLCIRLLKMSEEFISEDEESAFSLLLCGLEFVSLGEASLIEKWVTLCREFVNAERRRLQEPALIEKWTMACRQVGDGDAGQLTTGEPALDQRQNLAWRAGRPLVAFARTALEPTRSLVSVSQHNREGAITVCAAVIDSTIEVLQRDPNAAANCYTTSPQILQRVSLDAYRDWVRRGLNSFSDSDRLAAYFAAESRASLETIKASADTLQLQEIAPVISQYVEMLTGRTLPLEPREEKYDVLEPGSGESIVLPPEVAGIDGAEDRFRMYKALAAQSAGQIEFGTFESGTERLQALGEELVRKFPRFPTPKLNGDTDWHTLVSLFFQTTIARRLFTILENARVEFLLGQRYKGLRRDLDFARHERKRTRPSDQYVMNYEPLLEQLFIEALGDRQVLGSNGSNTGVDDKWLDKVREVLREHIRKADATVADTIRGCLELYQYLNPPAPESSVPWEDPNVKPDHRDQKSAKKQERQRPVESSSQQAALGESGEPTQPTSLEIDPSVTTPSAGDSSESKRQTLPQSDQERKDSFYYDEWDYRIGDYRSRWCRVEESDWRKGDLIFAKKTRAAYRGLLSQVRYQFELLRPVGLRRVYGQNDGDDIDLQALTDRVIDLRAHRTPSERIYSERQHRERDVAVCFLIDMSASTNARVNGGKHVLDIEKEALLLMSDALEAVGDAYAIYGFSSGFRRTTNVYRFKEFDEKYGRQVERRIGNAHSLVNTRLGVAIRHATFRLNQQPSATRLLIVLSDARPADDEYGHRYAREDTRVALSEARATGINNFFITFAQGEHQAEMEEMLEDTNFTIIDDIMTLPERMPAIYRRLTT
jgi:hypothetical protein